jgi:hypothetical protein
MSKHPYSGAAPHRRWRSAVAEIPATQVDPVTTTPFTLSPSDNVMTAGSCFAQHISRHLKARGFGFLETEPAHPMLPADVANAFGYGIYSARYGNVYTSRQLLQLLRRALNTFRPVDDVWMQDGRYFDPFRPGIQPNGFGSLTEYKRDRQQHLAAVRDAFEKLDYLVFTLGLTECWVSKQDGAAYPVCPGTVAGHYDPSLHGFINLSVDDVAADLRAFNDELRAFNPRARLILSVSPVPLAATATEGHVLTANTYSKAVLRVAAEQLAQYPGVAYFPAYEIITGSFSRGAYYADDLRSIREEGVQHVMNAFFQHYGNQPVESVEPVKQASDDFLPRMQTIMDTLCEESRLEDFAP